MKQNATICLPLFIVLFSSIAIIVCVCALINMSLEGTSSVSSGLIFGLAIGIWYVILEENLKKIKKIKEMKNKSEKK